MEPEEYERTSLAEESHFWFDEMRSIWMGLLEWTGEAPRIRLALDAGCGTGGNLCRLGRDRAAVGIDLSPLALAFARRKCASPLARGTILSLPFRSGCFDLVLCSDVLYHRAVPDDTAALSEMRRVLRAGGLLIVNVPAFDRLRSAHDRAMHTVRRYSKDVLAERLLHAGLEPLRIVYWNGLLLPPVAVVRRLRRGAHGSEISPLPPAVNRIFGAVAKLDRAAAMRGMLPAGLSLAAVARRVG
ncbi:MAG: class I SAM-dependent methyltransferase [Candidatus Eisenbacteria bacterium]